MSITRRDFLNGVALTVGAGLAPWQQLRAQEGHYYPPVLTGIRGNHDGSNRYTHPIAFGALDIKIDPLQIQQQYDLVVVGAGIGGLSAAWFYLKKYPEAKILILDNHDDFGGHAKRNELGEGDSFRITYGGSESLDSPEHSFSDTVHALLKDIGVDYTRFNDYYLHDLYESYGLSEGIYFDDKHFSKHAIAKGDPYFGEADAEEVIAQFPLTQSDKDALIKLFNDPPNYFPEKSAEEIEEILSSISYDEFLSKYVGLTNEARAVFRAYSCDYWGYQVDGFAAIDGYYDGYPGFDNMPMPENDYEEEPYIYHFPDGNASIARMLVRAMIPNVAKGNTMDDIVLAKFDYSQLDLPENNVRIRLNSTAAALRNKDDGVDVVYMQDNKSVRVRAKHSVLACYYRMTPPIVDEIGDEQAKAINENVKIPFLYSKVLIKNWHAFRELGVHNFYCPTAPYSVVKLDYPVSMGDYEFPTDPDQPIVLHMVRACAPYGTLESVREMAQLGRKLIYGVPYETLEQEIIDQLNGILSLTGQRIEPLIEAITINRWAHGYSYEPMTLFDSDNDIENIIETARQPVGNIHLASSDSGWSAYMHVAIDEAHRAINEMS